MLWKLFEFGRVVGNAKRLFQLPNVRQKVLIRNFVRYRTDTFNSPVFFVFLEDPFAFEPISLNISAKIIEHCRTSCVRQIWNRFLFLLRLCRLFCAWPVLFVARRSEDTNARRFCIPCLGTSFWSLRSPFLGDKADQPKKTALKRVHSSFKNFL